MLSGYKIVLSDCQTLPLQGNGPIEGKVLDIYMQAALRLLQAAVLTESAQTNCEKNDNKELILDIYTDATSIFKYGTLPYFINHCCGSFWMNLKSSLFHLSCIAVKCFRVYLFIILTPEFLYPFFSCFYRLCAAAYERKTELVGAILAYKCMGAASMRLVDAKRSCILGNVDKLQSLQQKIPSGY